MGRIVPMPVLVCVLILGVSIYYMFHIKYQVRSLYHDVHALEKEIIQEQDSIKVLAAELAYLNRPERLKIIAKKYLPHFQSIKVSQLNPRVHERDRALFVESGKNIKNENKIKSVNFHGGN